ncbi:MAG: FAD-dependent oxidoreductase, partial [Cyanobacteria bacterium J06621_12]
TNFQAASLTEGAKRQELLTVAIVGGGATGVELAGAIAELAQAFFAQNHPEQNTKHVRIILIHSQARLLADFPDHLGNYTARQLRRRGVKVYLETRVSSVMAEAVELNDGTVIKTAAIIWTAGVEANLPTEADNLPTAKSEKVCVRPTLQTLAYPEVYAVGDVAFVKQDGDPLLGIAPEAIQQGTAVAGNLKRQLQGRSPQPFNYFNKGTAAIIARNAGVAYLFGKIPLQGWFAWLMWLGIHLYYLPGLNNRLKVFNCWIKDYFGGARKFTRVPAQATVKQLFSNHSQS